MSSQPEPDLVTRISQLEQQQVQLKKYMTSLKRRLDEYSQQFNTRPEPQQLAELQKRLDELCENQVNISSSPETEIPISVEIIPTIPLLETEVIVSSSESQLVFDRLGSRSVLLEALEIAEERVIIVCPWLNCNSIDDHLLQKFRFCLNRNCKIEIGWGYLGDRNKIGKGWRYNALGDLQQLEQEYPDLFRLKLLGTHEKYLVCDDKFAMVGSHNVLTSGVHSAEREVGIRTTDLQIIQGLINRFDESQETEKSEIVQQFLGSIQRLDEAEYLEGIVETEDIDEDEEDENKIEEEPKPLITGGEFLRLYNEGQRDFTEMNLVGIKFRNNHFFQNVNFSKANLYEANFNHTIWENMNLIEANLKEASLNEVRKNNTNNYVVLDRANLENATLYKAQLQYGRLPNTNLKEANLISANLQGADLRKADLTRANLSHADLSKEVNLTEANLSYANLTGTDLSKANLRKANLSHANLSRAILLEANLQQANLTGANLESAIYNETTNFPIGFDINNAKAYYISSKSSLKNANMSGRNLSQFNLSGANLEGANLSQANLTSINLSSANLRNANLNGSKLTCANLCGAILTGATFQGAELNSINWSNANLSGVNLSQANLLGANLKSANLNNADLRGVYLSGATLGGANLISVDLRAANLKNADLTGADLTNAKLDGADLTNAKLKGATMPDGTVHE
ncbi:pentapeptide repeat-containing protein [Limnoraphis robusta Tam1]|uniref:pentapeptide repeat-containing protein n=1 Tax=Limnoraphis robusta TaxID=1118279 RepID=UPI002B20F3B6|nr:pentapeptide repeat-containing protein [Limnoraphis robusta]MEA5543040.1 pentapeptide repeat-containing protein [Limnoraphis robusta Tam1]